MTTEPLETEGVAPGGADAAPSDPFAAGLRGADGAAPRDPFAAARAASMRRALIAGVVAAGVLIAIAVGVAVFGGRRTPRPALPSGVVAQLRATSLALPVDPLSGYQRLENAVPEGARPEAAALAEDGTLALVFASREQRLVVLRGGSMSSALLTGARASVLAFTPESELYVGFDDGLLATLAPGAPATALVGAPRGAAPASTVTGFAFDRATKKSAVLFAGGEVFTALRPFRADALHPVTIPPNARVRHAAFTHDSELVLAGDRGQVFVSDGDAWDALPLATSGAVVALATDLAGDLLVAQSNGEMFRRDGGWESLGQAPQMPLALGELGALGIVALLNDGRVVQLGVDGGAPTALAGFVPRGAAIGGQIAGSNVLILASERVIVAEPGDDARVWVSDAASDVTQAARTTANGASATPPSAPNAATEARTPRDCRVLGATMNRVLGPPMPLVICDQLPVVVSPAGARPASVQRVAGRELPASEFVRLLRARHDVSYAAGQLLRRHDLDEPPSLLVYRLPELRYAPLVTLPIEEGRVVYWSVAAAEDGGLELVTASLDGTVRFARVPAESLAPGAAVTPIEATVLASRESIATLRLQVMPPQPVALGGGHVLLGLNGMPTLVARLDAARPDELEPVPVRPDTPGTIVGANETPLLLAGRGAAWLARPGQLEHIGATGDAVRASDGVTLDGATGTVFVDATGALHALAAREASHALVLECLAARCSERAFPPGADPRAIFAADGAALGVLELSGRVALFTR